MATAYDLSKAYLTDSKWVSRHALSINGKRSGITREDLLAVAESMNIKKASRVIDQVQFVVGRWNEFAESVRVEPRLRDAVSDTLVRV
ncbi:MAG: hypothetical protein WDZ33_02075 [Balneolaceae bacterium]